MLDLIQIGYGRNNNYNQSESMEMSTRDMDAREELCDSSSSDGSNTAAEEEDDDEDLESILAAENCASPLSSNDCLSSDSACTLNDYDGDNQSAASSPQRPGLSFLLLIPQLLFS